MEKIFKVPNLYKYIIDGPYFVHTIDISKKLNNDLRQIIKFINYTIIYINLFDINISLKNSHRYNSESLQQQPFMNCIYKYSTDIFNNIITDIKLYKTNYNILLIRLNKLNIVIKNCIIKIQKYISNHNDFEQFHRYCGDNFSCYLLKIFKRYMKNIRTFESYKYNPLNIEGYFKTIYNNLIRLTLHLIYDFKNHKLYNLFLLNHNFSIVFNCFRNTPILKYFNKEDFNKAVLYGEDYERKVCSYKSMDLYNFLRFNNNLTPYQKYKYINPNLSNTIKINYNEILSGLDNNMIYKGYYDLFYNCFYENKNKKGMENFNRYLENDESNIDIFINSLKKIRNYADCIFNKNSFKRLTKQKIIGFRYKNLIDMDRSLKDFLTKFLNNELNYNDISKNLNDYTQIFKLSIKSKQFYSTTLLFNLLKNNLSINEVNNILYYLIKNKYKKYAMYLLNKYYKNENIGLIQDSNQGLIQDSNKKLIQDSNQELIQDSNKKLIQDSNQKLIQDSNKKLQKNIILKDDNPNIQETLLYAAIINNYTDIVKTLFNQGFKYKFPKTDFKNSLLCISIKNRNSTIAELLINNGHQYDYPKCNFKETPLCYAFKFIRLLDY